MLLSYFVLKQHLHLKRRDDRLCLPLLPPCYGKRGTDSPQVRNKVNIPRASVHRHFCHLTKTLPLTSEEGSCQGGLAPNMPQVLGRNASGEMVEGNLA